MVSVPQVLAIAAHPDDIEFVMSGTMLRLADAGYGLHYLNLADGCCGSSEMSARQTAAVRREEARRAAAALGAEFHESLCRDLEILYELELLRRLAAVVRRVAPRILLVHSPEDYMEDHTNACRLAVTAAFSRGMPNFEVQPPTPITAQEVTIYHAQPHGNCTALGRPVVPTHFVDVTSLMDRKTELLACHKSQQEWLDRSQAMGSYLRAMRDLLSEVGAMSGRYAFAEGWRRHSHWGFCAATADPLFEMLGDSMHRVDESNRE